MDIFQRKEIKYYIPKEKYTLLLERLSPYIQEDIYSHYSIYNIYLDNQQNYLIYHSLDKPAYKEKLRIRSYHPSTNDDVVFFEQKKKSDGIVYKRRAELPFSYINALLEGKEITMNSQILNEIKYQIQYYQLKKAMVLIYDRDAYVGKYQPELRITFDTNIAYRTCDFSLERSWQDQYILQDDYLLEIKALNTFPLWLCKILSDLKIYPTSFSKYGTAYKKEREEMKNV